MMCLLLNAMPSVPALYEPRADADSKQAHQDPADQYRDVYAEMRLCVERNCPKRLRCITTASWVSMYQGQIRKAY